MAAVSVRSTGVVGVDGTGAAGAATRGGAAVGAPRLSISTDPAQALTGFDDTCSVRSALALVVGAFALEVCPAARGPIAEPPVAETVWCGAVAVGRGLLAGVLTSAARDGFRLDAGVLTVNCGAACGVVADTDAAGIGLGTDVCVRAVNVWRWGRTRPRLHAPSTMPATTAAAIADR